MLKYEYRVVPSPQRAGKGKGDAETRFAGVVAAALNAEAAEGWEFVRTETLPRSERQGLTGSRTLFSTVMIYRRPVGPTEEDATRAALRLLEDKSERFQPASDTDP